jgi:hypothetical protein
LHQLDDDRKNNQDNEGYLHPGPVHSEISVLDSSCTETALRKGRGFILVEVP